MLIYSTIEDIEKQFTMLFEKVENKKNIIANIDDSWCEETAK